MLCVLFTACRFHELEQQTMSKSIFDNDAIHIHTHPKTSIPPSYLPIPCLGEEDEKICPAIAVNCLWERVRRTYESRDTFLLNASHHTPLKTSGISKLEKLGMTQVGIPQEFRLFTIKLAAISALIFKGVPEVLIARHALLSPTAHTPTRCFLRDNVASDMAHALVAPRQEDQTALFACYCPSTAKAPFLPASAPQEITNLFSRTIAFPRPPIAELNNKLNSQVPSSQTVEPTRECSRIEYTTIRTVQTSEIGHIQADI
ncbi:uncharacterized protein MONOS_5063 [Monocercomonoides exilis]|uniref:uncharacterized protein n=1 Tax=Monocercomonoides exilis TaxID=2049356 RepID=UPI00355A441C|nr:hypothetical protein MONOS_5063 [Monocercomonoides exilis]|eukprot:MONOS_5063.1-p1 / transcript=MONOS_5063.1 / gene=MONOS_5063 / organism=Monocercomonoides_exilis_PA203 / gene_product=unspecified product / transcript_product=unspecified product / location=Mono_scaffold00143:75846-76622(+) / protein_length=259 / sequence_SO=supercontig / SO=protein_coding / is_pseudo=false